MTPDVIVSRELKSLQDEISASQRERSEMRAAPAAVAPAVTEVAKESTDEGELRDQLRDLTSEVTSFFEEAEKGISAHPTQSVVGALLVGILIGRLLGRR
jgi:ElaB/YqjD/DUF883 family membrane-anchored ribosome-binding protein